MSRGFVLLFSHVSQSHSDFLDQTNEILISDQRNQSTLMPESHAVPDSSVHG